MRAGSGSQFLHLYVACLPSLGLGPPARTAAPPCPSYSMHVHCEARSVISTSGCLRTSLDTVRTCLGSLLLGLQVNACIPCMLDAREAIRGAELQCQKNIACQLRIARKTWKGERVDEEGVVKRREQLIGGMREGRKGESPAH